MEQRSKESVADIRITDPDTRRIVDRIRIRRRDNSLAKTARNLIRERATQLGLLDEQPGTMGEVGNASPQG